MGVDFNFYTTVYEGALVPEEAFAPVARRAQEILHADTFGRSARALAQSSEDAPSVRLALCALAELCWRAQQATGQGFAVSKESVGTWSREYALPMTGEIRVQMLEAEQKYLGCTGMLYRGRCRRV